MASALAAVVVHAALASSAWYLALAATTAAALAAYLALLPAALPAGERHQLYRVTRRITNRAPR